MIDATLFAWAWSIANAIPMETLAYAAALIVATYLGHKSERHWMERTHQLEVNQQTIVTSLHALDISTRERLAWQDKMVDKMWQLLGVRVEGESDTSESSSHEAGE